MDSVLAILRRNFFLKEDPKRLSQSEEIALFERYKQGNRDAAETLILSNLYLVPLILRRHRNYEPRSDEFKDMLQVGAISIIEALPSFNASLNFRLSTFLGTAIRNDLIRHHNDGFDYYATNESLYDAEFEPQVDQTFSPSKECMRKLILSTLDDALSEDELTALRLRLEGKTFEEIAAITKRRDRKFWSNRLHRATTELQKRSAAAAKLFSSLDKLR